MKKEMLINVLQPEECRIAVVEDGVLEELYVERASQESYVGNIYKGRIVNIEPSIQAAFVDFGIGRNGFLHVSDVDPAYYRHLLPKGAGEGPAEERPRRPGVDRKPPPPARRQSPPPPGTTTVDEKSDVAIEPKPSAGADEDTFGAGLEIGEAPATPVVEKVVRRPVVIPPPPAPDEADSEADDEPEVFVGDSDFGAGLDLDELPPPQDEDPTPLEPAAAAAFAPPDDDIPYAEVVEDDELPEVEPPAAAVPDEEGPKSRRRGDQPKRRRGNRRRDTESGDVEPSDDADPRPMDSAERRTSGDEPELDPPLDDGGWSFGPDDDEDSADEWTADDDLDLDDSEPALAEIPAGMFSAEASEGFLPRRGSESRRETEVADDRYGPADDDDDRPARRERRDGRDRGRDRDRDRRGARGDRGRFRGRDREAGPDAPPIQEIFKRGQEVIVQVIKEPLGTKGPTLSTKISIPGRYLVLAPWMRRIGVSRKIEEPKARARLRDIFDELAPPKGTGFVIRTACADQTKKTLQNELTYLLRLWQVVVRRLKSRGQTMEVYRDSDMIIRTIRDIFSDDVTTIWIDEKDAYDRAKEFLQVVMPDYANRLKYYEGTEPLFHRYGIEREIAKIHEKRVELPRGGSLVIEQTEALVAIDVNSGNFRSETGGPEETAFEMNMQASKEIARQLRLRDLGGVIVNDFIDMREEKHRRAVEKAMRDAVERDRARTKILRISHFGLIEMTRQRIRTSLHRSTRAACPHCHGSGEIKTAESMSIEVMRAVQLAAHRSNVREIQVRVHAGVADYLLNRKRREIAEFEAAGTMLVSIYGQQGVPPEHLEMSCFDQHNHEIRFAPFEPTVNGRGQNDRRRR